jgi:hypothetical protein
MGRIGGDCRRSSKSTLTRGGQRPRRATQISVGKIGSGQIRSRLFLFWPCFQFGVGGSADISRRDPSSYPTSIFSRLLSCPQFIFFHIFYFIYRRSKSTKNDLHLTPPLSASALASASPNYFFCPFPTLYSLGRTSRPHRSKPRLRRLKLVNKLWQHSLL